MTERTTVRLPGDLVRRAKRRAAADGRTLTSLIEDGLRTVLTQSNPAVKKKRVMPRVSKAVGRLAPGADVTRSSSLQEIDDLEYAERMKRFK